MNMQYFENKTKELVNDFMEKMKGVFNEVDKLKEQVEASLISAEAEKKSLLEAQENGKKSIVAETEKLRTEKARFDKAREDLTKEANKTMQERLKLEKSVAKQEVDTITADELKKLSDKELQNQKEKSNEYQLKITALQADVTRLDDREKKLNEKERTLSVRESGLKRNEEKNVDEKARLDALDMDLQLKYEKLALVQKKQELNKLKRKE